MPIALGLGPTVNLLLASQDSRGTRLHYLAANELAVVGANIDDASKGRRKTVGGAVIRSFGDQGQDRFEGMVVDGQSVEIAHPMC